MGMLTTNFPSFPYLLMCVLPAMVAYIVICFMEGRGKDGLGCFVYTAVGFLGGVAFLAGLVFPLMILLSVLFLSAKLISPVKKARFVAALGLLPFLFVVGLTFYRSHASGRYVKLDYQTVPPMYLNHQARQADKPLGFTSGELLEGLRSGPELRRKNSATLLLHQAAYSKKPETLKETADAQRSGE